MDFKGNRSGAPLPKIIARTPSNVIELIPIKPSLGLEFTISSMTQHITITDIKTDGRTWRTPKIGRLVDEVARTKVIIGGIRARADSNLILLLKRALLNRIVQ
jgi:hypothetical protein